MALPCAVVGGYRRAAAQAGINGLLADRLLPRTPAREALDHALTTCARRVPPDASAASGALAHPAALSDLNALAYARARRTADAGPVFRLIGSRVTQ
ncbi:hypothetical protein [Streptomyces sp. NPDC001275]